jgi:hypothetical protein
MIVKVKGHKIPIFLNVILPILGFSQPRKSGLECNKSFFFLKVKTNSSPNMFENKENPTDLVSAMWIQKAFSSVYGPSKSVDIESVKLEKPQHGTQHVKVNKLSEFKSPHSIYMGFKFPLNKDISKKC